MKLGLYCSIIFHLSIILLMLFGISLPIKDVNNDYAIVTEVVPVSAITNIKVKRSEKIDVEKAAPIKPPQAKDLAESNSKPEPIKEVDKKVPLKPKDQEVEKIPDKKIKEKEKVKEISKPKDKPKESEKKIIKSDDFAKNILKSLEQEVKKKEDSKKVDKEFQDIEKALKGETNKEYNPNIPMSISEIDGIKSQITSKWNTASFSGSAEKSMQIIIKITLDMLGNVTSAIPIKSNNSSTYYQPFVESALRAVTAASPLKNLSQDKYNSWKEIEFRFDSSGMIY